MSIKKLCCLFSVNIINGYINHHLQVILEVKYLVKDNVVVIDLHHIIIIITILLIQVVVKMVYSNALHQRRKLVTALLTAELLLV